MGRVVIHSAASHSYNANDLRTLVEQSRRVSTQALALPAEYLEVVIGR
jgi:hypothetical protein